MSTEALRDLIIHSVGLGLVISLVFAETLGLAAGGMVVPGYIALMIHEPTRVVGTVAVAVATFGLVKLLSTYAFIFGLRRIVLTVLIGFFLGWLSRDLLVFRVGQSSLEFQTIGLIIPGLIANWMDRQGVVATLSMMVIAAIFIRLLLMILTGGDIALGSDVIV
ncbi:MAG: poly-gamma-glutamate biosynthesis protein PgsC [candidate division Zixibacteria bacterium]|nr:poly-gamma-glutamate biosynthesis protein PgsC [candidate division Zixibacteria bacterium]